MHESLCSWFGLLTVNRRVFSQHVISHLGRRHGLPHRRPGFGHRVAAEVHNPDMGRLARAWLAGLAAVVVAARGAPSRKASCCISCTERFFGGDNLVVYKFTQNSAWKRFQRHDDASITMFMSSLYWTLDRSVVIDNHWLQGKLTDQLISMHRAARSSRWRHDHNKANYSPAALLTLDSMFRNLHISFKNCHSKL